MCQKKLVTIVSDFCTRTIPCSGRLLCLVPQKMEIIMLYFTMPSIMTNMMMMREGNSSMSVASGKVKVVVPVFLPLPKIALKFKLIGTPPFFATQD